MANVPYTWQEYFQMFGCLAQTEGDPRAAANLYREQFAELNDGRRFPDHRVFVNLQNRLAQGGALVPGGIPRARQGRRDNNIDPDLERLVLEQFNENPNLSTRIVAVRLGLDQNQNRLVHRILKANGLHPFHYQKVQALAPRDFQRRINFCNMILQRPLEEPNFLSRILWTDECTFTPNGMFNSKNYHDWEGENPFNVRQTKHQYRWSINVWAGIIGNQLVSY